MGTKPKVVRETRGMQRIPLPDQRVLTFRVYPEGKRLFFDVYVWETRRAMRYYLLDAYPSTDLRSVLACVLWPTDPSERPSKNYLGEIHFNRHDIGPDTISHEATHAALCFARHLGLDVQKLDDETKAPEAEERVAYAVGALSHQIDAVLMEFGYKT